MATIGQMDVTPQLLHDVEFREAKRGGYNTQDVDEFLERLAVGLERYETQMREARQRLDSAEGRVAEAERRAVQAEQRSADGSDADETLKRTLVLAQRTADAAIREAEDEAARTLASAQDQAARLLADAHESTARARAEAEEEARRAQQDARAQVLAEMRELELTRDQLRTDVELLESHLEDQRERLRSSADVLHQLLEDPGALAAVPVPEVSNVTAPQPPARTPLVAAPFADEEVEEDPSAWLPDSGAWSDVAPDEVVDDDEEVLDDDLDPATEPVDVLAERDDADDDAYLAELRKAMTDDSPLGPRDDLFDAPDTGRSRFGRRR